MKILEAPASEKQLADKMRKKILSYCHQMGWYVRVPFTNDLVLKDGKPILDFERIDDFCVKRGKYHKELNAHTLSELSGKSGVVFQFHMLFKHYLSAL